jgi:hypothetical protein
MKSTLRGGLLAFMVAGTAQAHHSSTMYEPAKIITTTATVKELQWISPHAWLHVMIADAQGIPQEWGLELGAPFAMLREGWKPHIVLPGEGITVVFAPLKDGGHGGSLRSAKKSDGTVIGGLQPK